MGTRLLERLANDVASLGVVESMPRQDGRNMTMVLGPVRRKAEAVSERRKRAEEINSQRMTKSEARRMHAETGAIPVVEAAASGAETPAAGIPIVETEGTAGE
jgi:translation initiation factor IF-3